MFPMSLALQAREATENKAQVHDFFLPRSIKVMVPLFKLEEILGRKRRILELHEEVIYFWCYFLQCPIMWSEKSFFICPNDFKRVDDTFAVIRVL